MKKLISLLLAVCMALALFACGAKPATDTPAPASTTPAANAPAPGNNDSTPDVNANPSSGSVGYIDDPVDHQARKTYKLAYLSPAFMFLQQSWFAGMQAFEKRLNFTVTSFTGDSDNDKYLTTIELIAAQGYDGYIVDCEIAISIRAHELLEESGLPYIAFVQSMLDENMQTVCPQVVLDQYETGAKCINWLIDNYKSYWGDVDTSKLGLIDVGVSTAPDLAARAVAPKEIFEKAFPGRAYFFGDAITAGGVTPDAAYALVTATISANPQVEYWWVTGSTEFFGVGAARAIDDLGKVDKSLVCIVGAGAVVVDWDSMTPDTKTSLVACLAISDLLYAAPAVSGIVAMIDGRATKDTLWRDVTPAGYKYGTDYGVWFVANDIVTRDTYKTYFDEINTKYLESGGHA